MSIDLKAIINPAVRALNPGLFPPDPPRPGAATPEEPLRATAAERARAKRVEDKLETKLQDDIIAFLRSAKGIRLADRPRPDKPSTVAVGRPDIVFSYRPFPEWMRWGIPVGCEVKRPGEKPTKEQSDCHADMRADGWFVFVAYGVQDVRETLRGIDAAVREGNTQTQIS